MKEFWRAVRLALAYRWTLIAAMVCALMVGILWGANIAAVQPLVEAVFNGKSLPSWNRQRADTVEQSILKAEAGVASLEASLAGATDDAQIAELERQLKRARAELKYDQKRLATAQWLQPYLDSYLPHTPFGTLVAIAGLLLAGTLLKIVFLVGNTIFVERVANLAALDLRKQLFRRTLKMPPAAFDTDGAGELMSRFTYDIDNVFHGVQVLLGKAVREPLKMLVCLAGAAYYCWRLLLLSLVLAPVAAFLVNRLARSLKRANRRAMEEMSLIYALLEETFLSIRVVQAFTMEHAERKRFHDRNKKYYQRAMRIAGYDSLTRPLTELTGISTILVALLCGAYLVLEQKTHLWGVKICPRPLEISELFVFYGFLTGVSDPARKLSEVFSRLQRGVAASERIFALMDRPCEIRNPAKPKPLPRHHRDIEFRGINFHYKPGTPVLKDINLRVAFGETVAIVGPNGCGKTTLVNLLPRFFDPTQGAVLVDGIDVRETRLRELRGQMGLVPQNTLLFDDSVFNNIRYGCPDATREQVIAASKQAYAHQFIEAQLSDGYETSAGPQGNQLSGGQRQRIALARAILRDPAILILDEATSQIDVESEQLIHQVLEEFTRDRTAIIITHRLSTLVLADRIIVMDGGRIIDVGKHAELLGRCDLYLRLHDVQFKKVA